MKKVLQNCFALLFSPFFYPYKLTYTLQKGSVWDELEFLTKTSNYMKEQRVVQLFKGICDGVRALHYHQPTPLSHRWVEFYMARQLFLII